MNTKLNFSKEDITFDGIERERKLKEELFDSSLLIAKRDKEIERLNAELELYKDNQILLNVHLNECLNIIKEAREYVEKHRHKSSENLLQTCENFIKEQEYLLSILDKENKQC